MDNFLKNDIWTPEYEQQFHDVIKKKRNHKFTSLGIKIGQLAKSADTKKKQAAIQIAMKYVTEFLNDLQANLKGKYIDQETNAAISVALQGCSTANEVANSQNSTKLYSLATSLLQVLQTHFPAQGQNPYLIFYEYHLKNKDYVTAQRFLDDYTTEEQKKYKKQLKEYPDFAGWYINWMTVKRYRELAYLHGNYSQSDKIISKFILHVASVDTKNIMKYEDLEKLPYKEHYGDTNAKETNDLKSAAENIVVWHHVDIPEIVKKNKDALVQLDLHLKKYQGTTEKYTVENYKIDFINLAFIPSLGAYIGEVLCNQFGGKWIQKEKLMESRIQLNNQIVNPFYDAYKVAYFNHRLVEDVLDNYSDK
jgi:hypothetical protein